MIDEDTGEEPGCIYCGSTAACPHLLVVWDMSFCECRGGYCRDHIEEFTSRIQAAFLEQRGQRTHGRKKVWKDELLQELWEQLPANEEYESADELYLDGLVLQRLIADLLLEADGDRYPGPVVEDIGWPGMSSAMAVLYSEDPKASLDRALSDLDGRLRR